MSKPHENLQTINKTHAKFQKDRIKLYSQSTPLLRLWTDDLTMAGVIFFRA